MGARLLLRFDDICPGMNWPVWRVVEETLRELGIRPLLAVVPDNRDPELNVHRPDPSFWDHVRGWQQLGWSIGLHGFQHRCTSASAGILGRNRSSEFAGLPESEQKRKLETALGILRKQRVRADAWIVQRTRSTRRPCAFSPSWASAASATATRFGRTSVTADSFGFRSNSAASAVCHSARGRFASPLTCSKRRISSTSAPLSPDSVRPSGAWTSCGRYTAHAAVTGPTNFSSRAFALQGVFADRR